MISTFKKNKKGIFIFIGSEASKIGGVQGTLYSSAKHALYGFVKSLRKEANKASIRATIINPGMVRTNFFENLNFEPGNNEQNVISVKDISSTVAYILSLSRNTIVDEINL